MPVAPPLPRAKAPRRKRGARARRCRLVLALLWGLAGSVASGEAAPIPVPTPITQVVVDAHDRPVVEPGRLRPPTNRLILKLRAGSDVCIGCRLQRGQRLGALGVGSRLDGLFAAHGIRNARPLLRHQTGAGRPDARTRFPARAARAPGGTVRLAFDRTWVLTVRAQPDLGALARTLAADPAVEYCEPDAIMEPTVIPNDPFFGSQGSWGQPYDDLWGAKRIGAPAAWDVTRGAGTLIAVVDTGIDDAHPDLAANMWINPGEIAGNALDDDGNGFVDDVRGWDFADGDVDPHDDYSHGTHVAGTIAAVGGNGLGITGIAYESQVMAVRGLGSFGYGFSSDLAAAILYAVDNGADVINASWGGGFSQTIADAVSDAHAAGVVFVAAAGNSAADSATLFPAANPDAITVSAFTHADARASFSNYGMKLDVAAPGGGDLPPPKSFSSSSILSLLASGLAYGNDPDAALVLTSGGASYVRFAGTSMATPHVAGVAALVIASHPGISVEQVRQVLRTTADDVGAPGPDTDSGFGIVNAAAAVTAPDPLEARITAPRSGATLIGPLLVSITGSAQGPGFASYRLDYRPADDPSGWVAITGPVAIPVDGTELAAWDASALNAGQYVLRLRVERPSETFVDQVAIGVKNAALTAPEALAALRPDGPIEIRGTAAGAGFVSYAVEIRRPALHGSTWHTDGVTLASPGAPVYGDLLATLDASSLTEGDRFDFRLTVTNAAGTAQVARRGIVIDPTLRAGWPQQVIPGADREYLTLADLDGDGAQEVLVGSGSEVVVFAGDGSVRPGWPQSIALGEIFAGTHGSPLVADVTGDAAPEVIAISRDHVFVWSGNGTPQPGFPLFSSVLANSGNEWLSAGDLNGDGKHEIVSVGGQGIQALYGDGTPVPGMTSTTPIHGPAAVGDVFGDFASELAFYSARRSNVLTGNGVAKLLAGSGPLVAARNVKGTTYTRTWLADMDGDGRLDMVVLGQKPNSALPIKVTAVSATGKNVALRKPDIKGLRLLASRQLSFSDLDRDGRAEAWRYAPTAAPGSFDERFDHFAPYLARSNPSHQGAVEHRLFKHPLFNDGPFAIAIGDVDGDGVQELVGGMVGNGCGPASDSCTDASVRRALPVQQADGTLLPKFPKPVPQYFTEEPGTPIYVTAFSDDPYAATPAIGDLDGDGLKEIVWFDPETSRIFVWNVEGTPGPLLADWPMYAHDPQHSNTLPLMP